MMVRTLVPFAREPDGKLTLRVALLRGTEKGKGRERRSRERRIREKKKKDQWVIGSVSALAGNVCDSRSRFPY